MDTTNNKLVDIHSHILFGVDDGCETIEDSLAILEQAHRDGVKEILLTPHYLAGTSMVSSIEENKKRVKKLEQLIKQKNFGIHLYLGNEIMLCEEIVSLLKEKKCTSLNHSKYVLVELPMYNEMKNAKNIFFELLRNEYIPVLAHPERYVFLKKDLSFLKDIQEMGVLLQGNYLSIIGYYGKQAQKRLKKMLKEDMITFLGSDIHHVHSYELDKAYKKIKKIIGKDEAKLTKLFIENAKKILYNSDVN